MVARGMEGMLSSAELIPVDLTAGPVLLVNDDGIEARGFAALERLAAGLGAETWVAAPADGRSAASAMISLRKEIAVQQRGERRFAISGSPADCVLAGLAHILKDRRPSLVLSGINHGANVGDDMAFSGTVGAATLAATYGIPAIAISLEHGPGRLESDAAFAACASRGADIVRGLCRSGFQPGLLYNLNFPHRDDLDGVELVFCRQGAQGGGSFALDPLPDGRSGFFIWHHGDRGVDTGDSDYAHLRAGKITVTPIRSDRSDAGLLAQLSARFRGVA